MKTSLAFRFANFARRKGIDFHSLNDLNVQSMRKEIDQFGKTGIEFAISNYADGSWSAKSTNIDGIITGGFNQSEQIDMIKDAIFTYYDIAPKHCNDDLLKGAGEKKTVKNEIYVTA